MPELESQKRLIHESDWDVLIILDACRYDYFEEYHRDFIEGFLRKVISEGIRTKDWLKKTFGNGYWNDVIYVSANPFVNSKQVDIVGFDGTKHFQKILDAWKGGWNDDLKTVTPKRVGKITRLARVQYPDKRIISHFMQPHRPYLSIGPVDGGISTERSYASGKRKMKEETNNTVSKKLRGVLGDVMVKAFSWEFTQRMRKKLGLVGNIGAYSIAEVAEKYGKEELKKAYKNNLEEALIETRKTIDRLPDNKIIITADHGEMLGEEDIYGHPCNCEHPILREVPWLEVEQK